MQIKQRAIVAAIIFQSVFAVQAIADTPVQWTVNIGQPIYNTPRVRSGTIYLDTSQAKRPNVFAVRNGKILWSFDTKGMIQMPVTVGWGQVFVASDIGNTHYLRALNSKTGKLIWDYTRHEPPQCMCSHVLHYGNNLIFAQTDGHSLYAFVSVANIPTKRIWKFVGDGAKIAPQIVADDHVIFGSADHDVYALNPKNGDIEWVAKTGYAFVAEPAVWKDSVILGNRGGTVHSYNLQTGKSLWSFSTNGPITTKAAVWGNFVIVASGPGDRGVYGISAGSGKQIWYTQLPDYTEYSPKLIGDSVIVASRDGYLYDISAKTGKIIWRTNLYGVPLSAPVIWRGRVVVKVNDHKIESIDAKSGRLLWTYKSKNIVTAPVAEGMSVYFGTSDGKLVAVGS